MQVVRANTNSQHYRSLARHCEISATESGAALARALKRAIEVKVKRIDGLSRSGIVLVLDAVDWPALCFPRVLESFQQEHGDWARSAGFQAVWLVGPTPDMIHQIA
jgi:hypothetical protein